MKKKRNLVLLPLFILLLGCNTQTNKQSSTESKSENISSQSSQIDSSNEQRPGPQPPSPQSSSSIDSSNSSSVNNVSVEGISLNYDQATLKTSSSGCVVFSHLGTATLS